MYKLYDISNTAKRKYVLIDGEEAVQFRNDEQSWSMFRKVREMIYSIENYQMSRIPILKDLIPFEPIAEFESLETSVMREKLSHLLIVE